MDLEAEREMIQRCLAGESAAWDELFAEHYGPVGRYIFQISSTFTREDADEICQEVFLSVVNKLGSFGGKSRLQTWLFRIAANKARDYHAKTMAAKRGGGEVPLSLQAEDEEGNRLIDPPSSEGTPDEGMIQEEDWRLVGEGLAQLGGPCQEILELRYFGDLSYHELSVELEINEKTVSSRISKCKGKLASVMRNLFSQRNLGAFSSQVPSKG